MNRFNKPEDRESKYYRTYEDSPNFRLTPGALTPLQIKTYNLADSLPASTKFLPLTNLQVINNSSVNIYVFINGSSTAFVVPNGSNIIFDRNTMGGGIRYLEIQNSSTTVTTGATEVDINLWKEGIVIDEAFRKMHKAFFSFLFRR